MIIFFSLTLLFFIPCILGLSALSFLRPSFPPLSLLELPGVVFCLGLCVLVITFTIGYILQESTVKIMFFSLMLATFVIIKQYTNLSYFLRPAFQNPRNLHLWISFIFCSIIAYRLGSYLNISSDSIHHTAYIRKFFSTQKLLAENFQFSSTLPVDELFTTYVYNAIFPLFSFISQITTLDPIILWQRAPTVLTFIALSVFYSTSIRFFNSHIAAVWSIIIIIIYWSIEKFEYQNCLSLRCIAYPNHITCLVFLVLISFIYQKLIYFNYSKGKKIY